MAELADFLIPAILLCVFIAGILLLVLIWLELRDVQRNIAILIADDEDLATAMIGGHRRPAGLSTTTLLTCLRLPMLTEGT